MRGGGSLLLLFAYSGIKMSHWKWSKTVRHVTPIYGLMWGTVRHRDATQVGIEETSMPF